MKRELLLKGVVRIIAGLVLVMALLFIPAGTLRWKEGWFFILLLFLPMFIAGLVMYFKAPELLESRLNVNEERNEQKLVIILSGLIFVLMFVLSGLNYRFEWITLPKIVSVIASLIFLLSYLMFAEVLRENAYLSRTIEVTDNQKVVDTGPYGIVRHPMYFATVFLFLSMPLILGSPLSFAVMLLYIPVIVKRILDEEKLLEEELEGYREYEKKVRYRLVPFIW